MLDVERPLEWEIDPTQDATRRQCMIDQLREDAMDAEADGDRDVALKLRSSAHDLEAEARTRDLLECLDHRIEDL